MRFVGGALLFGWATLNAVLILGMNGGPHRLGYLSMSAFFAVILLRDLDYRRLRRSAKRSAKPS
jgi:hypothetical protein